MPSDISRLRNAMKQIVRDPFGGGEANAAATRLAAQNNDTDRTRHLSGETEAEPRSRNNMDPMAMQIMKHEKILPSGAGFASSDKVGVHRKTNINMADSVRDWMRPRRRMAELPLMITAPSL